MMMMMNCLECYFLLDVDMIPKSRSNFVIALLILFFLIFFILYIKLLYFNKLEQP